MEDPADLHEQFRQFAEMSFTPITNGFKFDVTPVRTEITTLGTVIEEFAAALDNGLVDPDAMIPQLIQKLKDAGADRVIAEKQRQFDQWLEENGLN